MPAAAPTDPLGPMRRDVDLAPYTTLGVGGKARYFAAPQNAAQLSRRLAWARSRGLATFVLGGGSNVVVADAGFAGLVLKLAAATAAFEQTDKSFAADVEPDGSSCVIRVDAGCPWDAFCRRSVAAGLQGMECLVGIPGTMGAAVVQNVGAYGQQLSDVLQAVEVVALADGAAHTLAAPELGLGYRTSHFKGAWAGRYVITGLQLRLHRRVAPPCWPPYAELRRAFVADGQGAADGSSGQVPSTAALAQAVLALRRRKSMVLDPEDGNSRSVGSFFINPTIAAAAAQALREHHPALPVHPMPNDEVKLAAAWLIEGAGLRRGHVFAAARGRVGLSSHHALALINLGDASACDVVAAAQVVRQAVHRRFGITLQPEPQFVGFANATPYL